MAGPILTRDFIAPVTVSPSSEAASDGYAAANLLRPTRPFEPWRSTSIATPTLVFDFGSAKQPAAIVLNRANFTRVTACEWGTTPSSFDLSTGAFDLPWDRWAQSYFGLQVVAPAAARRYCRLTLGFLVAGQTFYQLGGVLFVTAAGMTPLEQGFGFPRWSHVHALDERVRPDGSRHTNELGPRHVEFAVSQPVYRRGTADAAWDAMRERLVLLDTVPHLYYQNRTPSGPGAYLVRRVSPLDAAERYRTADLGTLVLREEITL